MNFQQLRIIRETLRHNFNLTGAAGALRTSQSGVSKHIRDLESELGVEIFVRRGKRVLGLTEPGQRAAEIVERILKEVENLEHVSWDFDTSTTGMLTVATTHTQARYVLPNVITEFKKTYPDVRLILKQMSPKEIASAVFENAADIGIATDTLEQQAGVIAFPYHTWEHAVIVPKSHPLAGLKALTLERLSRFPLITYDEGLTGRTRIDDAFEAAGITPDYTMSALDADVIKTYVEHGLGVGIIASMAFDPQRDTKLSIVRANGLFAPSTSSIAIRHGKSLRKYAYRFITLCSPLLTEDLVRRPAGDGR